MSAQWTSAAHDELRVTFHDPAQVLTWQPGAQADFEMGDGVAVVGGQAAGHALTLQLAGPSAATTVSYASHAGGGAFVTNQRGVGILTFEDFPITP